jgi:hypothetical protein
MADNEYIWVRAIRGVDRNGVVGEHEVLLFEKDSVHPNGEAFIAGPIPVQVGESREVARLLKDKDIEKVSDAEAKKAGAAADPLAEQRAALDARAKELDERENGLKQREAQLQPSGRAPRQ